MDYNITGYKRGTTWKGAKVHIVVNGSAIDLNNATALWECPGQWPGTYNFQYIQGSGITFLEPLSSGYLMLDPCILPLIEGKYRHRLLVNASGYNEEYFVGSIEVDF
jgi:hypothetical protein